MVPLLISADRQKGFVSIDNSGIACLILLNPDRTLLELFNGREEPLLPVQDNFWALVSIVVKPLCVRLKCLIRSRRYSVT